ncbi:hypothetical protein E2C01_034415 [Portunus trituberculatus]|uniref:Uncharacterized protein n=1 Tax=Portunus trituberculatus TaxID=210409 RepID=A0A5B7F1J3_PORTR|nr:hypothetical protein [Portunus trituberculatus]
MVAHKRVATFFIVEELSDNPVLDAVDIIHSRNEILSRQEEKRSHRVLQKKVKTPVVILIVIWETETNPHIDVHKPSHIAYSPRAMRWCVSPMIASTGLCLSAKSQLE